MLVSFLFKVFHYYLIVMKQTRDIFTYVMLITWCIGLFILAVKFDIHVQLYCSGRRKWFCCDNEEDERNHQEMTAAIEV